MKTYLLVGYKIYFASLTCYFLSDAIIITTAHKNIDLQVKKHVEEVIKNIQSKLPKREYPRKPLVYDIQWQDINTVKECGQRQLNEWSANNIPKGYPKLWLYAFDSIKHHIVIYR